ncbi:endonuclease [Flavobacterium sp. AS60]|uniref:endonuclease n=1 Tax=Flavobacterium anseongense TaxID=2910677 RepID=UPI001F159327|nr:endonuclease [Flavobacterium sp. AS60]MCF6128057.1 endonuclease [Flavobacterium sp. AS60]
MFKKILPLLVLLAFSVSNAQIVINELDADTPSVDEKEFIELKSTTPFFALDGYTVVLFNGSSNGLTNLSYYAIDLDGLVTDGNGIILLSNPLVSPSGSYSIPNSTIQNGPDAVAIYLGDATDFPLGTAGTTVNLINALVYSNSGVTSATTLMTDLNVTASYNENANSAATTQSIQRKADGTYEVKAPTPRANNDGSGIIYNGITTTFNSGSTISEGENITITFTTDVAVTSDLNFSITLNNGSFNSADFEGNLNVTIPSGSSAASKVIQILNDGVNDGDEEMKVTIGAVPSNYIILNNNNIIRVNDVNYTTLPFGTPANPTYGNISRTVPAGYYDSLEGKSGATLKQAIQDIIANPAVVRAHTYGDIINILKTADQNPLNNNQVWLIYTEQPRSKFDYQTNSSIIGKWNREHIYSQSRGNFGDLYNLPPDGINVWSSSGPDDIGAGLSDAHHLRAADGQENSSRGNRNYGIDYNGPTAIPTSSWKGDVARACFYMAVRYNGLNVVNGNPNENIVGQIGDLTTLLTWNHSDPSDDFEMNRNNYIYTWQQNRNPFIDYPDLVDYVFGANVGQAWFAPLSTPNFDAAKVVLYPNPAKDNITIYGITTDSKIEVFSTLGQKVFEQNFAGETTLHIDLASGIYMSRITTDSKTIIKKIIVQ